MPCIHLCYSMHACYSLSHVWLFATPWTVAHQAPLSMGFSRKEYSSEKKKRILEWVVMLSSRGSSQPRDRHQVSCTACRFFTMWVTRDAQVIAWFYANLFHNNIKTLFSNIDHFLYSETSVLWSRTSSMGISQKLVRNVGSQALSQTYLIICNLTRSLGDPCAH